MLLGLNRTTAQASMECTSCPYGTYQRALSAGNLTVAGAVHQPELFERAMLAKLSEEGKEDPEFVRTFLAHARKHLDADFRNMQQFRL